MHPIKALLLLLVLSSLASTTFAQSKDKKASTRTEKFSPQVEKLLSQMTLEEKAGQMTQVDLSQFVKQDLPGGIIDQAKLDNGIKKYGIGSILNNGKNHAQTLATWHKIINTIDSTCATTRLKIPIIYGIDAIHGPTYLVEGTLFAQNIGLACSRNQEMAKKLGALTGHQTRMSGVQWNFAPVLDVGRQPLWSRFCETFGEDPYITTVLGSELIKGMQGDNLKSTTSVAACMKHFIGYSWPFSGKDRTPTYMPDWMMREYFLPPFQAAVKAGAKTIMINSGELNGEPVHASSYLLTDVLRKELGFKGIAVTDWEDINNLHTRHKIASNLKEATYLSVMAGIDMSMTPYTFDFANYVVELVKEGRIPMDRIDLSVGRILQTKADLGLFENAKAPNATLEQTVLPSHEALSLEASREAIVLLKNQVNALPLNKTKTFLVVGPAADWLPSLSGSWSYSWQGNSPEFYPSKYKSFLGAFTEKIGKANVSYFKGCEFDSLGKNNIDQIVKSAFNVDEVIVVLGEAAYAEVPGNIDDLTLPAIQIELAKRLSETGKKLTLVLLEGRPRVIREIEPLFNGIVLGMIPGPKGGEAISEILFGEYNPNGKLPFTYPRYPNNYILYDYKYCEYVRGAAVYPAPKLEPGYYPQYDFGHGLSYTTYKYSDLKISTDTVVADASFTISINVQNTGKIAGKEAVDLFITDLYASVTPAAKRVRGFTKVSLNPNETKTVSFTLTKADLAFVNLKGKTITEEGGFEILLGGLKKQFYFKEKAKAITSNKKQTEVKKNK